MAESSKSLGWRAVFGSVAAIGFSVVGAIYQSPYWGIPVTYFLILLGYCLGRLIEREEASDAE